MPSSRKTLPLAALAAVTIVATTQAPAQPVVPEPTKTPTARGFGGAVSSVDPYATQIVDYLLGERSERREFRAGVAVPYPHPGIYSLGFVTGEGLKTLNEKKNDSFLSVFIPSSPAPVSS